MHLYYQTPIAWVKQIIDSIDTFLPEHATAEKKASGMALSMISHYPDKKKLVIAMTDLAVEELSHFRSVVRLIYQRGLQLTTDTKDPYIQSIHQFIRNKRKDLHYDCYFLDRLLTAGIIEARGAERFGMIAKHITDPTLKKFYQSITDSEKRHQDLFIDLAHTYFDDDIVTNRLEQLLQIEAEVMAQQPLQLTLH